MENIKNIEIIRFHLHKGPSVPDMPEMTLACTDITICLLGEMHYLYNGEDITLCAGDAIIMREGDVTVRFRSDIPNRYASFNLHLPEEYLPDISGAVRGCITPDLVYMIESFGRCYNTVSPRGREKCIALFEYVYNEIAEVSVCRENAYIIKVKQYVRDNLSGKITLDELAEAAGLTSQYLCAVFKKETGTTIVEYINAQRIEHAKRLMLTSRLPLSQVAQMCGFSDNVAFSHRFKSVEGISPSEYVRTKIGIR